MRHLLAANAVREKLAKGECVTGTAHHSWSPIVMEVMGLAGVDFVRIDNEHAWRQDSSAEDVIRACLLAEVCPILRVDRENPYLIRKAFEIGAQGIIVPDVHTVADAEAVVRAAKFPPRGTRGFSNQCASGGWTTIDAHEWVEWSDRENLVGIMIENPAAMDSIDDIMAVDGIDFALFGPADFSLNLGLRKPALDDERVVGAIIRTIEAAKKSGKHVMYNPGLDPAAIKLWKERGLTMFEMLSDTKIIHAALSQGLKTVADA